MQSAADEIDSNVFFIAIKYVQETEIRAYYCYTLFVFVALCIFLQLYRKLKPSLKTPESTKLPQQDFPQASIHQES